MYLPVLHQQCMLQLLLETAFLCSSLLCILQCSITWHSGCCRWSDILTPGPAFLRTSISKGIRHTLWANHMWLKHQQLHRETNDSDEDDTEQFGIQEGVHDGGEQVAANDEDEEEVLPLYGEADSDFGDASSEVVLYTACFADHLCAGATRRCRAKEQTHLLVHVHVALCPFRIHSYNLHWSSVYRCACACFS